MKRNRMRVATLLVGLVAALTITASPASANCHGKFAETCQEVMNQWCYLTGKCL
ncbi:MAG TPA: hypothetical protein VHN37_10580 [Actinomycetota bacterium]|nr:hypothetical protein [Actinomycetota bacterium]